MSKRRLRNWNPADHPRDGRGRFADKAFGDMTPLERKDYRRDLMSQIEEGGQGHPNMPLWNTPKLEERARAALGDRARIAPSSSRATQGVPGAPHMETAPPSGPSPAKPLGRMTPTEKRQYRQQLMGEINAAGMGNPNQSLWPTDRLERVAADARKAAAGQPVKRSLSKMTPAEKKAYRRDLMAEIRANGAADPNMSLWNTEKLEAHAKRSRKRAAEKPTETSAMAGLMAELDQLGADQQTRDRVAAVAKTLDKGDRTNAEAALALQRFGNGDGISREQRAAFTRAAEKLRTGSGGSGGTDTPGRASEAAREAPKAPREVFQSRAGRAAAMERANEKLGLTGETTPSRAARAAAMERANEKIAAQRGQGPGRPGTTDDLIPNLGDGMVEPTVDDMLRMPPGTKVFDKMGLEWTKDADGMWQTRGTRVGLAASSVAERHGPLRWEKPAERTRAQFAKGDGPAAALTAAADLKRFDSNPSLQEFLRNLGKAVGRGDRTPGQAADLMEERAKYGEVGMDATLLRNLAETVRREGASTPATPSAPDLPAHLVGKKLTPKQRKLLNVDGEQSGRAGFLQRPGNINQQDRLGRFNGQEQDHIQEQATDLFVNRGETEARSWELAISALEDRRLAGLPAIDPQAKPVMEGPQWSSAVAQRLTRDVPGGRVDMPTTTTGAAPVTKPSDLPGKPVSLRLPDGYKARDTGEMTHDGKEKVLTVFGPDGEPYIKLVKATRETQKLGGPGNNIRIGMTTDKGWRIYDPNQRGEVISASSGGQFQRGSAADAVGYHLRNVKPHQDKVRAMSDAELESTRADMVRQGNRTWVNWIDAEKRRRRERAAADRPAPATAAPAAAPAALPMGTDLVHSGKPATDKARDLSRAMADNDPSAAGFAGKAERMGVDDWRTLSTEDREKARRMLNERINARFGSRQAAAQSSRALATLDRAVREAKAERAGGAPDLRMMTIRQLQDASGSDPAAKAELDRRLGTKPFAIHTEQSLDAANQEADALRGKNILTMDLPDLEAHIAAMESTLGRASGQPAARLRGRIVEAKALRGGMQRAAAKRAELTPEQRFDGYSDQELHMLRLSADGDRERKDAITAEINRRQQIKDTLSGISAGKSDVQRAADDANATANAQMARRDVSKMSPAEKKAYRQELMDRITANGDARPSMSLWNTQKLEDWANRPEHHRTGVRVDVTERGQRAAAKSEQRAINKRLGEEMVGRAMVSQAPWDQGQDAVELHVAKMGGGTDKKLFRRQLIEELEANGNGEPNMPLWNTPKLIERYLATRQNSGGVDAPAADRIATATPGMAKPEVPAPKAKTTGGLGLANVKYGRDGDGKVRQRPNQHGGLNIPIEVNGKHAGLLVTHKDGFHEVHIGNQRIQFDARGMSQTEYGNKARQMILAHKQAASVRAKLAGSFSASKSSTTSVKGWKNYSEGFEAKPVNDGTVHIRHVPGDAVMKRRGGGEMADAYRERQAEKLREYEKHLQGLGYSTRMEVGHDGRPEGLRVLPAGTPAAGSVPSPEGPAAPAAPAAEAPAPRSRFLDRLATEPLGPIIRQEYAPVRNKLTDIYPTIGNYRNGVRPEVARANKRTVDQLMESLEDIAKKADASDPSWRDDMDRWLKRSGLDADSVNGKRYRLMVEHAPVNQGASPHRTTPAMPETKASLPGFQEDEDGKLGFVADRPIRSSAVVQYKGQQAMVAGLSMQDGQPMVDLNTRSGSRIVPLADIEKVVQVAPVDVGKSRKPAAPGARQTPQQRLDDALAEVQAARLHRSVQYDSLSTKDYWAAEPEIGRREGAALMAARAAARAAHPGWEERDHDLWDAAMLGDGFDRKVYARMEPKPEVWATIPPAQQRQFIDQVRELANDYEWTDYQYEINRLADVLEAMTPKA